MNTVTIEIYSLIIIVVILVDYLSRYRKMRTFNYYTFLIFIGIILLLSVINIVLSFELVPWKYSKLLFILTSCFLVIPPSIVYLYVKYNHFNNNKYITTNVIYIVSYVVIYSAMVVAFFHQIPFIEIIHHITDFFPYNKVIIFSLMPLFVIWGESFARYIKYKNTFNMRLFFSFVLPIIGVVLDIYLKNFSFTVPSYTLAIFCLYLYRSDRTLNNDNLTGLFNRRILDEKCNERILNRRARYNLITAFYYIDIDKFKKINDSYGHNVGDEVLKATGDIIKKSIRSTDYPIRIGGDEFLIIAELDKKENIGIIINKIYKNIAKYNSNNEVKISLSIGSSIYNPEDGVEDIMSKIDKNMYDVKQEKK